MFQVFRALANILELLNYSMTFYIYCLFSEDFRNTLLRTMKWPWFGDKSSAKRNNDVSMREILKELNRNAIKNNEYSEWGAKRNRGEN